MLSHVFYQAPLGLEFANTKNRKGVILFRVVEGSTAKKNSLLRRGMLCVKVNGIDITNETTKTLPSLIRRCGFPVTLSFMPAPKRSEESIRQTMLLKKIQRKFKLKLDEKRKAKEAVAKEREEERSEKKTMPLPLPPRPKCSLKESNDQVSLPIPPRPGTSPTNLIKQQESSTTLLANRCTNCGQIAYYPSVRLRALFVSCGLCKLQFSHMEPHKELYVRDIVKPMPKADACGPQHSIFTEKQILTLHSLAASIGSAHLPQRTIDITNALNYLIKSNSYVDDDTLNYIELNKGFNCSTNLLNGATSDNSILSPRSVKSLRSNPLILFSRWQLSEKSGVPFRRWTTKQNVIINKDGHFIIDTPSIVLTPPIEPMLRVLPTSFFGNPNDHTLQYTVSEHIQGVIDLDTTTKNNTKNDFQKEKNGKISSSSSLASAPDHKDGSWLVIGPQHSQLLRDIGDPYIGADKTLCLDLDMQGFCGEIVVPSSGGHLHQPININGPILAPTLLIRKATYGAELEDSKNRRSDIPNFDPDRSVNVSAQLQKIVDMNNGDSLELTSAGEVSMEHLLNLENDPAPGEKKKLEIIYDRRGIRGRKIISINRNGTMKEGDRFSIQAPNLQDSRLNVYASASRKFGFSCPKIIIKSASYGTQLGVRSAQRIDVKNILQNRCDNSLRNNFSIGIEENLDQLFGCRMAPWEGCELRINFGKISHNRIYLRKFLIY
jgi:hypothetical protein